MTSLPDFRALLCGRGLRLTRPRQRILEHLLAQGAHGSAESIYRDLQAKYPKLGRATVFRTLKLFAELGLASETPPPARRRFEAGIGKSHHDHMTCLSCGRVVEFCSPAIERLQVREARRHGFVATGHSLELRGYCRDCARRRSR